jgi:hypothetical protein
MNGAELPSGSVLHVEPASSNSASSDACGQQSYYGSSASTNANVHASATNVQSGGEVKTENATLAGADNDEDEDLDDFFDSL